MPGLLLVPESNGDNKCQRLVFFLVVYNPATSNHKISKYDVIVYTE